MNSNCNSGIRGDTIKPSARRGIHEHRNCPFISKEGMGVYGLKSRSGHVEPSAGPSTNSEHGKDEVDNAQSKFARASSPILARRIKDLKRNSFDSSSPQFTDDDSACAKSLPAYLPSHSLSSDEFGSWQEHSDHQNASVASANSSISQQSRKDASSEQLLTSQEYLTNISPIRNQDYQPSNKKHTKSYSYFMPLLAIAVIVLAYFYSELLDVVQGTHKRVNSYTEINFYNDLNFLGEKYRIGDDSILQMQTGISTILKRQDAGSFIFVYKSDIYDFDQNQLNDLMNDVASAAARYLRNESTSVHHVTVDGSKLEMHTHSELMSRYREDLSKAGVMLVKEVDRVPSTLAMAFHYFCDEYNPLVKNSAIFFTLDLAKCSTPAMQQNTVARIETCLASKWVGVPETNIRPLLTRVVSTVVDITGH